MKYTYFLLLCFFLVGQASAQGSCGDQTIECDAGKYYLGDSEIGTTKDACCGDCTALTAPETSAADNSCKCPINYYNDGSQDTPTDNEGKDGSQCQACVKTSYAQHQTTSAGGDTTSCTCPVATFVDATAAAAGTVNGAQCLDCGASATSDGNNAAQCYCQDNHYNTDDPTDNKSGNGCNACGAYSTATSNSGDNAEECVCQTNHVTSDNSATTTSAACDYCEQNYYDSDTTSGVSCAACGTRSGTASYSQATECECDTGYGPSWVAGSGCSGCAEDYRYDGSTSPDHTCHECIHSSVTHGNSGQATECQCDTGYVQSDGSSASGPASCLMCASNYAGTASAAGDKQTPGTDGTCYQCAGKTTLNGGQNAAVCDCNPGHYSTTYGRSTDVKVDTCNSCLKTHRYNVDTCEACHVNGHDTSQRADGHTAGICDCKTEVFGAITYTKYNGDLCNTCGENYYNVDQSGSDVECEACYFAGTNTGNQGAGNVNTVCHCKDEYFGTTCNKCAKDHYDSDGSTGDNTNADNHNNAVTCAACHAAGVHATNQAEGNTDIKCACKDAYFSDNSKPKCDHCNVNFYQDDTTAKTCAQCYQTGTDQSLQVAGNNLNACQCNTEEEIEADGNPVAKYFGTTCNTCAEDYYDSAGNPTSPVCTICYKHGTNGNINNNGNTESICNCVAGYEGTQCDQCKDTHYDTQNYDDTTKTAGHRTFRPVCHECGANAAQAATSENTCDCDTGYAKNDGTTFGKNSDVEGDACDYCADNHYAHEVSSGVYECRECGLKTAELGRGIRELAHAWTRSCRCDTGYFSNVDNANEARQGRACDYCAKNYKGDGNTVYNNGNCVECTDGTASNDERPPDQYTYCDFCQGNFYHKLTNGGSNNGHSCTACPGDTTSANGTPHKDKYCLNSCADPSGFGNVYNSAGNDNSLRCNEISTDVSAVVMLNYHNKNKFTGTNDLRDVKGTDRATCCHENECLSRDASYWKDSTRFCGVSDPVANTVTDLVPGPYVDEYCVGPDGTELTQHTTEADCQNKGTWIRDGYKTCDIRCTSGKRLSDTGTDQNFEVTTGGESECTPKNNAGEWSSLGCTVTTPAATTKSGLGTVGTVTGYNQCLVYCDASGNEFTTISYLICGADHRGNGQTCSACLFGETNDAGDPAGPVPTFCTEVPADEYYVDDPETTVIDFSSQSSKCSNIDPKQYARLKRDGTLECTPCGRKLFLQSYNAATMNSAVVGTKHGICCQNSHHRVCRAMLEEYKLRCEYEDLVATKAANFVGSWYGKGKDSSDAECTEYARL